MTGTVASDVKLGTSKNGKPYASFAIRVGEQFVRVFTMDVPSLDDLADVKKGEAIAARGALEMGEWQGKPQLSLSFATVLCLARSKGRAPAATRLETDTPRKAYGNPPPAQGVLDVPF